MSAEYPSSNPFRRKEPSSPFAAPDNPSISAMGNGAYQQAEPPAGPTSLESFNASKKTTKKVRVQSPPPASPSIPDSTPTIREETYSIPVKPPTPIPRDGYPFNSINSDINEDDVGERTMQAPANPFSKTLETMEHPEREGTVAQPPGSVGGAVRASMDVDAFKRLLMTGNAGLGPSTPSPASQAQVAHHVLGDGGSSTDTSSLSRQSIFEAVQEPHPESPRTSHEISEPEDDRNTLATGVSFTSGRKKPPPPSSRHGKLIRVELKDDPVPGTLQSPTTPGSISSQNYFSSSPRSQTDLNKPLPPAPSRASHESDRESIFDREAAGKTPEPPSRSSSTRKRTPPTPPMTRRHSQLVADSQATRIKSGRLSPKAEEATPSIAITDVGRRPRSDSARGPPPPPSRRPGSIRGSSHPGPPSSPSTTSIPPPPPARGFGRQIGSGRPPSVVSVDMSAPTKRLSMAPPPPPPPRHGRSSMDGQSPEASRRPSGEHARRSIESARRGSTASSLSRIEMIESDHGGADILADLSALQKEIDDLRNQSKATVT